jgi:hypothetical protein
VTERRATGSAPDRLANRTLYRDGALADARSDRLRIGVSILVEEGRISWIRPSDDEGEAGARSGLEVVDASGTTFVPGMVDGHSHVTLPGGAHWIERIDDPPEALLGVAERNARLLTRAGVRWARDVGAPRLVDPIDGQTRALSLGLRERWAGMSDHPISAARGRGSIGRDRCRRRPTPWRPRRRTSCSPTRSASSMTGSIS